MVDLGGKSKFNVYSTLWNMPIYTKQIVVTPF